MTTHNLSDSEIAALSYLSDLKAALEVYRLEGEVYRLEGSWQKVVSTVKAILDDQTGLPRDKQLTTPWGDLEPLVHRYSSVRSGEKDEALGNVAAWVAGEVERNRKALEMITPVKDRTVTPKLPGWSWLLDRAKSWADEPNPEDALAMKDWIDALARERGVKDPKKVHYNDEFWKMVRVYGEDGDAQVIRDWVEDYIARQNLASETSILRKALNTARDELLDLREKLTNQEGEAQSLDQMLADARGEVESLKRHIATLKRPSWAQVLVDWVDKLDQEKEAVKDLTEEERAARYAKATGADKTSDERFAGMERPLNHWPDQDDEVVVEGNHFRRSDLPGLLQGQMRTVARLSRTNKLLSIRLADTRETLEAMQKQAEGQAEALLQVTRERDGLLSKVSGLFGQMDGEESSKSLNSLAEAAHANSVSKGFWEGEDHNFAEKIALIHAEASEALEEHRSGQPVDLVYYPGEGAKPEGVPIELADILIRVFDLAGRYEIDLDSAVETKMKYNTTRANKHGKKY